MEKHSKFEYIRRAHVNPSLKIVAILGFAVICPAASDSRPLERHFGPDKACYERAYSANHLASHPGQRVTEIRFDHFPRTYGTEDGNGNIRFNPVTAELYFAISVRFRGSSTEFSDGGRCVPEGERYRCQIDCDGGSFYLKDRDADSILLINQRGFRVSGCGEGDIRILDPHPDDGVFRLDRLPNRACLPPGQAAINVNKRLSGLKKRRQTAEAPKLAPEPWDTEGWTVFENGFSGWRVEYPSELLLEQPGNDNAAVSVFRSRDEEVEMIVYGATSDFDNLTEFRDQTLEFGRDSGRYSDVTYAPAGDGWFVLSGFRGNRIFYDKYVFSPDRSQVQAVLLEYPEYYRALWDEYVARIANGFEYQSLQTDTDDAEGGQAVAGLTPVVPSSPPVDPPADVTPDKQPSVTGAAEDGWAMYPVNPGEYLSPPGLPEVKMKPTCTGSENIWNFLFTHERGDLRAKMDFEVMYQDLPYALPPGFQPMQFLVSFGSDRDSIKQYGGGVDIPCSQTVGMRFWNLKWYDKYGSSLDDQ